MLPVPIRTLFDFIADARNLDRVTPDWFRLRILSGLPPMNAGTRIDYRMSLGGIPFPWTSEVTVWEPPHRFTYIQRRGPYRFFEHEHELEEGPGGTRMIDRVWYGVPGGAVVDRPLVRPALRAIFLRREARLMELLAPGSPVSGVGDAGRSGPRP